MKDDEKNGMQAVTRARDTRVRVGGGANGADRAEAAGCDLRGASPRTGRDKGAGVNAGEALTCGRSDSETIPLFYFWNLFRICRRFFWFNARRLAIV